MSPLHRVSWILVACALAGCSDDPTALDTHSQNIFFEPPPGAIEIEPFTQVVFKAIHVDQGEVASRFLLDGSFAHEGTSYLYSAALPGQHRLSVETQVGEESRSAAWVVHVVDEVSTPTPIVFGLELFETAVPGRVDVQWERPPSSQLQVPVESYLVHYAYELFGDPRAEGVQTAEIEPDPTRILQTATLAGLDGGRELFVRVQLRDVLGRLSALTPWASQRITAEFELFGNVFSFDSSARRWAPLSGALVSWRNRSTSTSVAGEFRLTGLSGYYRAELVASHGSGVYHDLRTLSLDPEDRRQDFHFLPFETHSMRIDGDEPETVDLARLLRIFSRTETGTTGAAKRIYRWEQYPVQVYLPQFVYEGSSGDLVDYRAIFLEGLEAWNRAAGEAMFELAEEEVELGVSYSATLAGPSAPLGEVVIVDPPNGSLFSAPPRQMLVRLRKFNTIHVARRVITHELGHLLLLGHSPDLEHCMNASAPNDTPTDLEGYVATLLAVMPQGLDMNFYREE